MPQMAPPGAPPQLGMGQPPAPPSLPSVDMARLREMWENTTPPQPVYPQNFRKPPRPNAQKVHEVAIRRFDELAEWRMAVRHDLQVLRGSVEGIFPDDAEDYYAGVIDEWSSPALIDEYNLAVSWLSGLQRRFTKRMASDELAYETRKVELAAKWLYEAESRTNMLDIDSTILEPKIMLAYGLLPVRRTLNRFAEPWESPFRKDYIDPAQLVWKRGRYQDGIEQVYRLYSARAEDLAADYGDFAPSVRKKLEDMYGGIDDLTEYTDVVEYWDPWYRCVTVGGVEIVPVTEHKYGEVPYSFGFSPLGEPRITVLPEQSASAAMSRETMRANAPHKSVGFIRFMKKQHAQYEAIMKRNLYSLKQGNNPSTVRYRSANASQMPAPDMTSRPGASNEAMLGEEKVEPFPYPNRMQYDQSIIMDAMMRDRQTGRAPMSAYGVFDQSNISGTATKMGMSAGAHLWKPWASELDRAVERDMGKAFRLWQRLGHTVEYAQPSRRPFVVPNERPMKGEPGSFELTKECLQKVGPNIIVRSDAQDTSDWVMRGQAAKLASELGLPKKDIFDKLLSITYDNQMAEEWLEEQLLAVAMQNPKFVEIVGIPTMFAAEMNEAQDDPERSQLLQVLLQGWMQTVVQPAVMEQQLQMGAMQGQQMQQQQAVQSMNGPTSEQSFSDTGQGPGSQTGNQGGPAGPTGPRSGGAG
jgi:hypothetical protein